MLEASVRIRFPVSALSTIAAILLLTGYLGGAVATQLRAGSTPSETVFPVLFGALVWLGVYLRDRTMARLGLN